MSRRLINEVGKRFGKLRVLSYKGKGFWECECDCGAIKAVYGGGLRKGQTTNCGCVRRIDPTTFFQRVSLAQYQANARDRGHIWNLSEELFFRLINSPCHYCGEIQKRVRKHHGGAVNLHYNGIDRKANDQGYFPENAVSCCTQCNKIKRGIPYEAFMAYIIRVGKFQLVQKPLPDIRVR